MNLEQYAYLVSANFLEYEFESVGPQGKIRKLVRYSPDTYDGQLYFNLGFGDVNDRGELNDMAISNNKDTFKILATIASSAVDVTERFPDAIIYARGSTQARTRLYQMGISNNWELVEQIFCVFGQSGVNWEPFRRKINYSAFMAFRK